jgi:diguanylate cyclase (GGDEF)-like protein
MEAGASGEVLIVDDDESFRTFVSSLLTTRGFKVWEARSVREGEQILAASNPRLIIVDYKLPDMDGVSWIGNLRNAGNNTPIAFISGFWCDRSTFNWLRNILKVSLVLQKPVAPEIFVEVIESIMPFAKGSQAAVSVDRPASPGSLVEQELESIRAEYPNSEMAQAELAKLGNLASQPESVLFNRLNQLRKMLQVEETLRSARANYLKELAVIWRDLTNLMRSIKEEPKNGAALEQVLAETHKVRGTAGSFQLVTIARCAERLENITQAHDPNASETESEIIWSEVFRVLADGELAIIESTEQFAADLEDESDKYVRILAVTSTEYAANLKAYEDVAVLSYASSHASALTVLSKGNFDAVIVSEPFASDPDLLAFCRDLRLAASNPSLPLLMVTAKADEDDFALQPAQISYAGFSEVMGLNPNDDELELTVDRMSDFASRSKPRVLVVDDDVALTDFLARILSLEGFNVETLNEPIQIIETLDACEPEVVVLDVIMPGLSGYDVCREIRNHERWRELAVLFLTAKSNQEGRALAFRAGGDDLIAKPVLKEELIARVTTYAERTRLRRDKVSTDQLTSLMSRQAFCDEAERRMAECVAVEVPFSLAIIAVDAFDKVDETFGNFMAESVIAQLGALIRGRFEPSVVKARWAERSFAIAFPDLDDEQAAQLVALLNDEFSTIEFQAEDGAFNLSLSAGFATAPANGSFTQIRDQAAQNLIDRMREKAMK